MASFDVPFQGTMAKEGFYSDHPNDSGGETIFGIARKFHPTWSGWSIVDFNKQQGTLESLKTDAEFKVLVKDFYKRLFWDTMYLDNVNDQKIAEKLFDIGVISGKKIAVLFLQVTLKTLNRQGRDWADIRIDGVIGPATVSSLNIATSKTNNVLKSLNILHGNRLMMLCLVVDPIEQKFLEEMNFLALKAQPTDKNEAFLNGWLANRVD